MSEGGVHQCIRFFKDGRTNIMRNHGSGRPSVVSADLKEIDEKIRLLRSYRFSNLAEERPSNFVSKEADGYRLLGCSRNLAYRIHDMRNNNKFQSFLLHVKETEKSHPEQTLWPTAFWVCASAP
ncbi:HTH_48 domain-containing protein [Trichonephila clavipes]|nr:HTH_48 domain-containing protein [Trichonephila clavipes]